MAGRMGAPGQLPDESGDGMTMAIRALIFDFDGSILDTERPDLLAWEAVFEEHGVLLPRDRWYESIGSDGNGYDVCAHLEELVGQRIEHDLVRGRHHTRIMELIAQERPRAGVLDWLDDAQRLGLSLAIASSSPRSWVEGHLKTHGLFERFRAIRCRDDVAFAKPAPDLFQAAIDAVGVTPSEAIAIEDSPNGVRAAKAAGLFCIAVPNEVTGGLRFDHADVVLGSLAERSLAEILTGLANAQPPRPST
jgi:HAD superfamily hydrolase (TIGR01509 family)